MVLGCSQFVLELHPVPFVESYSAASALHTVVVLQSHAQDTVNKKGMKVHAAIRA